jgi:hypothetical protein
MHPRARRPKKAGNNFLANLGLVGFLSVFVLSGLNEVMNDPSSHREVPTNPRDWLVGALASSDQNHDQPSIKIVAEIPQLSLVQQCTLDNVILPILDNPQPIIGRGKLEVDENTRTVFLALLFTESGYQQWYPRGDETDCSFLWEPHDPSEIQTSGVVWNGTQFWGIGQVGEHLCDPLDWHDPWQNTYCSWDYFVWLVREYDGDFTKAVAAYKGAVNEAPNGEMVVNTQHPHVLMLFDHLTLTK